jgi:hypothetical protein
MALLHVNDDWAWQFLNTVYNPPTDPPSAHKRLINIHIFRRVYDVHEIASNTTTRVTTSRGGQCNWYIKKLPRSLSSITKLDASHIINLYKVYKRRPSARSATAILLKKQLCFFMEVLLFWLEQVKFCTSWAPVNGLHVNNIYVYFLREKSRGDWLMQWKRTCCSS